MSVQGFRERLDEHYRKRKLELMRAEKRSLKAPMVTRKAEIKIANLRGQMTGILLAIGECFLLVENQEFPGFGSLDSRKD